MSGVRLLAATDRLFGDSAPTSEPQRGLALRWLGVAALLAAIILVRRPDVVTNPQFWAEDGYIFFRDNLLLGFPTAVAKLYQSFPQLLQRLIAFVGGLVPFAQAPRVYTTLATAITAFALASFVLPGYRHLVRHDALRALFGILVVCMPLGGETVLATPTNVGWFVAIWLSLVSLMRVPAAWWRVAGLAVTGCVVVLSTPLAAVNLPFWLLRIWRGIVRRDRRELCFGLALVLCTAAVMVYTRGIGRDARWHLSENPVGYLVRYVALVLDRLAAAMRPPTALHSSVIRSGNGIVLAWLVTAVAVPVALSAATRFRTLPAVLAAMSLYGGAMLVYAVGRPTLLFIDPMQTPTRYTIFPTAMVCLAVVALLDGVPSRRLRRALTAGTLATLCWPWAPRFLLAPLPDMQWAHHAERLAQKLTLGSRAPLVIPANPLWAPIEFDPMAWSDDTVTSGDAVLACLGPTGGFWQSFECRCDGLSAIGMRLAAEPSTRGALELRVAVSGTRHLVARARIAREDLLLTGGWEVFPFEPVAESAGKSYTVTLRAMDNDPDASVLVLGSHGDPYPRGHAMFGGRVLDADASLRYGCTRPP